MKWERISTSGDGKSGILWNRNITLASGPQPDITVGTVA